MPETGEFMEGDAKSTLTCPVGEKQCVIIEQQYLLHEELERLRSDLRTDTLTELYNYRHFSEALETEMERTQRSRIPTSLLLIDIDFFKKVNDSWGHEIGNRALRHLANLIRLHTRKIDIACRYGGEEFTIILPGTSLNLALEVAERLRHSVEELPLELDEGTLNLTVSIGVESYRADMHLDRDEFIHLTDRYLYEAKQEGRNRVCGPTARAETAVTAEEKSLLFS